MGMFNASVGKHDSSVKSGKQQDALERESSQGNFHFIDNYHRFIQQVGVVVDDLLKPILDTPGREVGYARAGRHAEDDHAQRRI
jgi:hypothetical protein